MSHYLAYVYGPADKETLFRVMAPYNENYDGPETGGLRPELVVLENVPVMTLETSLFDMIMSFRKVLDKSNYKQMTPILIVDDAMSYLDMNSVRELGAFVISYDLSSKKATAKVVVSRAFWDWWVVGGRWPIQFEPIDRNGWSMAKDIIGPAEVSWAVDKEALAAQQEGRYTSLRFGEIDWKKAKRERVKLALEMWDVIYKADPTLGPVSQIMKRMNLPKGVPYYSFNHEEYDAWHTKIRALVDQHIPNAMDGIFSPYDIAGMSRRELIRYAIARTYAPAFGIFWTNEFSPEHNGVTSQTTVFDFSWTQHPTDAECKSLLKLVRKLDYSTVVTAVDIHN